MSNTILSTIAQHAHEPWVQQEMMNLKSGEIDYDYFREVSKENLTNAHIRSVLNSELGTVSVEIFDVKNEVDKETFFKHYEFGKHPNVRGWISHIHSKERLVLTREKLYEYILERQIP